MKDTPRRCAKCGKSTAKHPNLSMSRFPKPGGWNVGRVEAWAKFILPNENWSTNDLHEKLYRSHKMLCEDHFEKSAFIDFVSKKLYKYAIPYDVDNKIVTKASTAATSSSTEYEDLELPDVNTTEATSSYTEHEDLEVHDVSTAEVPQSSTSRRKQHLTKSDAILYTKCWHLMTQICKLKKNIRTKNKTHILKYLATDEAIKELSNKITSHFAVLLQGQLVNCKNQKKVRKWNIQQKLIALQLYKRSPACYRLLRRLFCLPCQKTLKNLLNLLPLTCGINSQIFDVLKEKTASQTSPNNECMLLFDKMPIRKHLNYNNRKDKIEGFQDHGETQGRDPQIASHALVFMIVGIHKRFKQPIAYYLSGDTVTADRLAVLIEEVLDSCFQAGINIAATVCDTDNVNRGALNILGTSFDRPYFEYYGREIVALFDAPRLLKCFRNLFLKHDIICQSGVHSTGQPIKQVAKWSHISKFYDVDNNNPYFVFAPSLTKTHITPNNREKMRVTLAAQVLSHTVAAGIYAKVSQRILPHDAGITAKLISKMDSLFDALNTDSAELIRGKKFSQNLTDRSPHLKFFKDMCAEIKNLEFSGAKQRPPSQDGWLQTMIGVEKLWEILKNRHPTKVRSLATRRLQLDPLEYFFGCVHSYCGSNPNPTVAQFVSGFKTAIISGIPHTNPRTNCENDQNDMLSNLNHCLTSKKNLSPGDNCGEEENQSSAIFYDLENLDPNIRQSEEQACAFVCGDIIKRIDHSCKRCLQCLTSEDLKQSRFFVSYKECDETVRLCYANDNLIKCTGACASIMCNYINNNAHVPDLKTKIFNIWRRNVNFEFTMHCLAHSTDICNTIMRSVFYICIHRYCIKKNRMFSEEVSRQQPFEFIDIPDKFFTDGTRTRLLDIN